MTPHLSSMEGVEMVWINDFLPGWIEQFWRNQESYQSIEYTLKLAKQPPLVIEINSEWLKVALERLCENAFRAMLSSSAPRLLTLSTRLIDDSVEILFEDTGPGIPIELKAKLFKAQVSEYERGTGLGLLLAQMIIQVYGGDIRIGSTGPTGTTMIVRLPLQTV